MIGIIGAMHEEVVELKAIMNNIEENHVAGMIFYKGDLNKIEVILVESGIGKVNAAICTTILIEKFKIDKLIFTGVAGALNPRLDLGDIVISNNLMQHDFDATAFGAEYGEIPRMKTSTFNASIELAESAEEVAKKLFPEKNILRGMILSGDQFVSCNDKIKWLRDTFKGDCVEMEGASVAHVCYLYNLPFVVLRSISDKADHSAKFDFNKFVEIASKNSKDIVLGMLAKFKILK